MARVCCSGVELFDKSEGEGGVQIPLLNLEWPTNGSLLVTFYDDEHSQFIALRVLHQKTVIHDEMDTEVFPNVVITSADIVEASFCGKSS